MYSALYLPARPDDTPDPSKDGFSTKEAAEEYVFSQMCRDCKDERAIALAGGTISGTIGGIEHEFEASAWPACTCEWAVGPTKEFEEAEGFHGVMEAAGWEPISFAEVLEKAAADDPQV